MNYYRPQTLQEALDIRARAPVVVLAGGTDVYPARTSRIAWGRMADPDILDISSIAQLRGIAEGENHWRIGALTTWTDVLRAPLPPLLDGLKQAAREVGGVQIQNRGTIVGNICNASPAADGVPCLLTLDASIEIASARGTRSLPIGEFLGGYRQTVAKPDEIVTAISIPKAAGHGRFLKLGARRYLVISIVMVASVVEVDANRHIKSAKIAVGACSPVARRLGGLEHDLIGCSPGKDAQAVISDRHFANLSPIDDVRADAAYRAAVARSLVVDLLAAYANLEPESV